MRARVVAVGVLVMVVLSLFSASAYAAGAPPAPPAPPAGSDPETAAGPSQDWQPLDVDQRAWYAFDYAGDRSQVDIAMEQVPPGAVDFTVWTPADLRFWRDTGVERPVGEGHPNGSGNATAYWSGNFNAAGTYYVVVDHTSGDPSLYVPAAYLLRITGTGVTFPVRRAARRATATPTSASAGSVPESALAASANGRGGTLAPGQVRWFAFDTPGGDANVTVHLSSNPPNKATFSVWTLDEVQMFNAYGTENPVGRSAPNDRFGGDQVWAGNLTVKGKYYVRVEQTGTSAPVAFQLQVSP